MKQFNHLFQQMQKSKLSFKFPSLCLSSTLYFQWFYFLRWKNKHFFILNAAYTQAIIQSTQSTKLACRQSGSATQQVNNVLLRFALHEGTSFLHTVTFSKITVARIAHAF